jgi:hypothetical protein
VLVDIADEPPETLYKNTQKGMPPLQNNTSQMEKRTKLRHRFDEKRSLSHQPAPIYVKSKT